MARGPTVGASMLKRRLSSVKRPLLAVRILAAPTSEPAQPGPATKVLALESMQAAVGKVKRRTVSIKFGSLGARAIAPGALIGGCDPPQAASNAMATQLNA